MRLWLCIAGLALRLLAVEIHADLGREAARRGSVAVLAELRSGVEAGKSAREIGVDCSVNGVLEVAGVLRIAATPKCLDRLAGDERFSAIEGSPVGHAVLAKSIELVRHDLIAVVGSGLSAEAESTARVRTQACFGDCPRGPDDAMTPYFGATTEAVVQAAAVEGAGAIFDGRNTSIIAVRVAGDDGMTVAIGDALQALDWLLREQPTLTAIVLSFETDEAFCGPCEKRTVANRAIAAYLKIFTQRRVRVVTPDFGLVARGAPSCMNAVSRFPAAAILPRYLSPAKPFGINTIVVERLEFTSGESAAFPGPRTDIYGRSGTHNLGSTKVTSPGSLTSNFLYRNVRGLLYTRGDIPSIRLFIRPQFSTCALDELSR